MVQDDEMLKQFPHPRPGRHRMLAQVEDDSAAEGGDVPKHAHKLGEAVMATAGRGTDYEGIGLMG